VYVNNVIKGKLLESEELIVQAANNSKAQFASSPTLAKEIMNAIMDALTAHTTMSNQALDSEQVREGLKDVLLGPAQLYEALREKAVESGEGIMHWCCPGSSPPISRGRATGGAGEAVERLSGAGHPEGQGHGNALRATGRAAIRHQTRNGTGLR
jgi:hypothetical protein